MASVAQGAVPAPAEAIARLCAALGLPDVPIEGRRDVFRGITRRALSQRPRGIRDVCVSKTRTRYHVHGCVAELTDVVADGKKVRTTAIEDADPAKVIAAVRAMGLDGYPNINYPRGLKQLVGMLE